jgi:hypothetical protein
MRPPPELPLSHLVSTHPWPVTIYYQTLSTAAGLTALPSAKKLKKHYGSNRSEKRTALPGWNVASNGPAQAGTE